MHKPCDTMKALSELIDRALAAEDERAGGALAAALAAELARLAPLAPALQVPALLQLRDRLAAARETPRAAPRCCATLACDEPPIAEWRLTRAPAHWRFACRSCIARVLRDPELFDRIEVSAL